MPSLFDSTSSPIAALPTLITTESGELAVVDEQFSDTESTTSEYIAPLGSAFIDASIDGSVDGSRKSEAGEIRASTPAGVTEEDKAEALRIKSEANSLFVSSKYRLALDRYTLSLNFNPFDAAVWSNRAAVRLKLEEHGLAIADATRAIELDSRFVKAYFRRACANLAIMKPKAALTDLRKVVSLDPKNVPGNAQLVATQKLLRRLQFEAAISGNDEPLTSTKLLDQLANGLAPIEDSYKGPRLPESGPTVEFIEELIEWFKKGELIPRRICWEIVLGAYNILKAEPTLVDVTVEEGETINVIGDTHGQFYDFLHLLSLTGRPSPTHTLLFNGDFVDRGSWSTEIIIVLFAYKWLYPRRIFLNRGNHETADMNKVYGFEGETKKKYSEMTYKLFEEVFTALPLATLISASLPPKIDAPPNPPNPTLHHGVKRFFCVHGGLFSREEPVLLAEIKAIDRFKVKQPGHDGLMCEMLWTDPQDALGRGPSKRGVGIGFGPDITKAWTEANSVTAVIRSHEVRQGGYSVEHNGLCITVFSAPNYVDAVGNLAAFATISDTGDMTFTTFSEQPHPNIQPMAYANSGGFL